jgi:dihydroflavonol-4-reductase
MKGLEVRLLVTGGTGLLGNNVIRSALGRGFEVAALARSGSDHPALAGLPIQVFSADLSNPDSLKPVFESRFDAIVHTAAHIHIGWSQMQESLRINRDGTKTLLTFAQKQDTHFVHVSTVNTLAIGSQTSPANEETAGDGQIPCTYVVSKRAAELEVKKAVEAGQKATIVHPAFMLGPWDWKPSSGKMVQALQGIALLAPSGGCSVCDPRDVSDAILNAIETTPTGRHFILGGENLTYLELWRRICHQLGKRGPFTYMRLPGRMVACTAGDFIGRLTGNEPPINSAAVTMTTQFHWYSSERAIQELNYRFRPADDSIRDSIAWLRGHNMLRS